MPNIPPILLAKIPPLAALINNAIINHRRKTLVNPDRNEDPGLCEINSDTMNATKAILHQGAYKPTTNDKIAMDKREIKNFMIS